MLVKSKYPNCLSSSLLLQDGIHFFFNLLFYTAVWTWANSERWWGTERPGKPQSVGSQSQTWLGDWRTTITIKQCCVHFRWTAKELSDTYTCIDYGFQGGNGGEGIVREFEIEMHTLLYLKWITGEDLLYSTGKSDQYYVAAWMGWEFGGK